MALTYAVVTPPEGVHPDQVPGAYKVIQITLTGDTSYPTGGYAFGLTQLQTLVPALEIFQVDVVNNWWNGTNGGVAVYTALTAQTGNIVFCGGAAAGSVLGQITSGTNVSTYSCVLRVWYR